MNDRSLRNIVIGLGSKMETELVREDHFVIRVASDIMAVLCLANNLQDLKELLARLSLPMTSLATRLLPICFRQQVQ